MQEEDLGDLVVCGDVRKTEGRHMGNGAWWRISTKTLFCNVRSRAGGQSIFKAASKPFTVYNMRDGSMQNGNTTSPTLRLCVLDIYHRMTRIPSRLPKTSKTGSGNSLGMRLIVFSFPTLLHFSIVYFFQETFPNEFTSGDGKPG